MNWAIALLMFAVLSLGQARAQQLPPDRPPRPDAQVEHEILMILLDDPGQTHIQQIVEGFQEILVNLHKPPLLHLEFFDQVRFLQPTYSGEFYEWLSQKYRDRRIDVIVTVEQRALQMLAEQPSNPWQRLPVVYGVLGDLTIDISKSLPLATGVIRESPTPAAIRMIKQLMPDTKRIALIYGASAAEQERNPWFIQQVVEAGFDTLDLGSVRLPMEDLLARVAQLPNGTVPLFIEFNEDLSGRTFTNNQACQLIAAAANQPLFGQSRSFFGCGIVGGPLVDYVEVGRGVARQALKRLGPAPAETVRIPWAQHAPPVFDARQLARWGIPESRLPAGSSVLFREPGLWERYKSYVIGTVVLLLLQTTLIATLLVQRARRQRSEEALRESEKRFRLMADTAPVMVWRSGIDKRYDFFNRPWLTFTGRRVEQELGEGWSEGVHPEDLESCLETYNTAFDRREPFRMEYRLRRFDGEYRWVLDTGIPRFESSGRFAGYIGSCLDITERKEAEAALRRSYQQNKDLAGRLITAQEAERTRIARELHDDVGQRIASFSMAVGVVKRRLTDAPPGVHDDLATLQRETITLSKDLRQLSHELHPGVLEHLGLTKALKARCDEVHADTGVTVKLDAESELGTIPADAALCLYRIAQEALRNVVKHARAETVRVSLSRRNGHLAISVTDDGCGFEPRSPASLHGLGLVSLDERVRMLNGTFVVESSRGAGTTVSVSLPIGDVDATTTSDHRG